MISNILYFLVLNLSPGFQLGTGASSPSSHPPVSLLLALWVFVFSALLTSNPPYCAQILTTVAAADSKGLGLIYAGRVISGLGIGSISAVAPAYVSECSPKDVRGRITGLFQIMVAIGVMISYFINCAYTCPPVRYWEKPTLTLSVGAQTRSACTSPRDRMYGGSRSGFSLSQRGLWFLACSRSQ